MRRRNKYGAKKTPYDGVTYDSKAEAAYAARLDLLLGAGEIAAWQRQVPFQLGDVAYRADFVVTLPDGREEVHEVKGRETQMWRLKRRLWGKYGPVPLRVIDARKLATKEIVQGCTATTT